MTYLQIKNGMVINSIVLNDSSMEILFSEGFDYLIKSDGIIPIPGVGWLFDGSNFLPPPPPLDDSYKYVEEDT